MKRYPTGEPITKERIQDELWYPVYQAFLEILTGRDISLSSEEILDVDSLFKDAVEDYQETYQTSIEPEAEEMILRWCVYHIAIKQTDFEYTQ